MYLVAVYKPFFEKKLSRIFRGTKQAWTWPLVNFCSLFSYTAQNMPKERAVRPVFLRCIDLTSDLFDGHQAPSMGKETASII